MKLSVLVSLIIHGLFVFFMVYEKTKDKPKEEESRQRKASYNFAVEIITPNKAAQGAKKIKKKKEFYWGVGISPTFEFKDIFGVRTFGYGVQQIYEGYSAYESTMQVGDFIYLIDGLPITDGNDIRGDGPRKMLLTVLRDGVSINLEVDRCKVYY